MPRSLSSLAVFLALLLIVSIGRIIITGDQLTVSFSLPELVDLVLPSATGEILVRDQQNVTATQSYMDIHCPKPNISQALACFQLTTPSLSLRYPEDALSHTLEIHNAVMDWITKFPPSCAPQGRARHCGPWIENNWIRRFLPMINSTVCLSNVFGPYVPLVLPWLDVWFQGGSRPKFPRPFLKKLIPLLRPDVPYLTLVQNDEGLGHFQLMDNILVLSAGGNGHVPVPLYKQEEPLTENPRSERKWLLSYAGSLGHAPQDMRYRMHNYLSQAANGSYAHFYVQRQKAWKNLMEDSWVSLAPRGVGRTSYHLMEIIQRGHIPVHIYLDVPWVPYRKLYEEKVGFAVTVEELPSLLRTLRNMTSQDFLKQQQRIASYRETHFTPKGVMDQIQLFLKGAGDLECMAKPSNPTYDGTVAK